MLFLNRLSESRRLSNFSKPQTASTKIGFIQFSFSTYFLPGNPFPTRSGFMRHQRGHSLKTSRSCSVSNNQKVCTSCLGYLLKAVYLNVCALLFVWACLVLTVSVCLWVNVNTQSHWEKLNRTDFFFYMPKTSIFAHFWPICSSGCWACI